MRASLLAPAAVVVAWLAAAPASAGECAEEWEGRSMRVSGVIEETVEVSSGWAMATALPVSATCELAEVYGEIELPEACRPGAAFEVLGQFEYNVEDEHHRQLWVEDLLTVHAARINCLYIPPPR